MRCFVCSDIHLATHALARLLALAGGPLDGILFAGDLTNWGTRRDATAVLETFPRDVPIYTIPGNCDTAAVMEVFAERTQLVQAAALALASWTVIGFGGGNAGGVGDILFSEEELRAGLEPLLRAAPPDRTILITHQPPRNSALDQSARGGHVGSPAIRTLIDTYQPAWHFCGHIHESWGEDTLGGTRTVNVAAVKEGRAGVLDLDVGTFTRLILPD